MKEALLRTEGLRLNYQGPDGEPIEILRGLDLSFEEGDFTAITGPSGSGKSTLFYLLGCLLRPSAGRILFRGRDLSVLNEREIAEFRNREIGFVFQQFHLLPRASVLENILLPARYPIEDARVSESDREKARHLAQRLGLGGLLDRGPQQLSGGQQQRVAIARALMRDTKLLLADEPTGNLDSRNSEEILRLFHELNNEGRSIVLITHDPQVAAQCRSRIHLKDGLVENVESVESVERTATKPLVEDGGVARSAPVVSSSRRFWLPFQQDLRLLLLALPGATLNLRRNRAKSLLTMVGVVIGVAAVLSTITLGQFAKRRILESYESLGVNTLTFRGWANWRNQGALRTDAGPRFQSFDWERDLARLPLIFPEIELMSPQYLAWGASVGFGGNIVSDGVRAIGIGEQYALITDQKVSQGRPLTVLDIDARSPVCVLGAILAEKLFMGRPPLGEIIQVLRSGNQGSYPCKVVGVNAKQPSFMEWWQPDLIVNLPHTYFRIATEEGSRLQTVSLKVRSGNDPGALGDKLRGYFEQRYGQSGEFLADSNAKLISQMKLFLGIFSSLLAAVAVITLGVGGVGINNMMLVSLAERLKEIGLRKALGATGRSLRFQILSESLLLCVTAGVLGLVVGFAGYQIFIFACSKFIKELKYEWVFDPWAFTLSLGAMVLTGILSGLVPSVKAEKLQVIDALRSE